MKAAVGYGKATRSRLTIEYVLLSGVNDSLEHAKKLEKLIRESSDYTDHIQVNLIPYNSSGAPGAKVPTQEAAEKFRAHLANNGIITIIRKSRGQDIGAACGQLLC